MKLLGEAAEGSTGDSPDFSEEDICIARTILNMSRLQLQLLEKVNRIEADQKTILEESRRERRQNEMFLEILNQQHENEMERLLKVMKWSRENQRSNEGVHTAVPVFSAQGGSGSSMVAARALAPSLATFAAAASPSTFFGAPPSLDESSIHYLQQQQQYANYLQQQQQFAVQQNLLGSGGIGMMNTSFPATLPQSIASDTSISSPAKPLLNTGISSGSFSTPPMSTVPRMLSPALQAHPNTPRMPFVPSPLVESGTGVSAPCTGPSALAPLISTDQKTTPKSVIGVGATAAVDVSTSTPKTSVVPPIVPKVEPAKPNTTSFSFAPSGYGFATSKKEGSTAPPLSFRPTTDGFRFGESAKPTSATGTFSSSGKIGGEEEDAPEPFEPSVHFEPVVPLPDLVELTTGEEGEKVLFTERCKLYRYVNATNEWKERGIGDLKILQNPENKSCRIVMRRDQVHKVCANHKIQSAMTLTPMQKSDKAYVWMAQDFSEGELVEEKFAARFKTHEVATQFASIFNSARASATAPGQEPADSRSTPMKPTAESKTTTAAVAESKTDTKNEKEVKGFGDAFKPAAGSWECKSCYVRNAADATVCLCCGAGKDGSSSIANAPKTSVFSSSTHSFGITFPTPVTSSSTGNTENKPSFRFAPPILHPAVTAPSTISSSQPTPSTFSFKFPVASSADAEKTKETSTGVVFGAKSSFSTSLTDAKADSQKPKEAAAGLAFGAKPTFGASTADAKAGAQKPKEGAAGVMFGAKPTFGLPSADAKANASKQTEVTTGAVFGAKPAITSSTAEAKNTGASKPLCGSLFGASVATSPKSGSVFGGSSAVAFNSTSGGFAALAAKAQSTSSPKPAAEGSKITAFAGGKFNTAEKSIFTSLKKDESKKDGAKESGKEDESEEFEPTAHFEPVIPLPSLVEVKTGEEGEKVLFKSRAKLYRYVTATKEYKERGLGEIKILLNPENGRCRVVMRRDQVLKVCANAPIHSAIKVNKKPGNENTCMWMCRDYSEDQNGTDECFVARFKDAALADDFLSIFREAIDGRFAKREVTEAARGSSLTKEKTPAEATASTSDDKGTTSRTEISEEEGGKDGDYADEEDVFDEEDDAYEELADFPAKMKISEAFASPLKPGKVLEVDGVYSMGIQHDANAIQVDILDEDGEVKYTHLVGRKDTFKAVDPKSIEYLAVDEKSKSSNISVEFKDTRDRDEALDHLKEGVKMALEIDDDDGDND